MRRGLDGYRLGNRLDAQVVAREVGDIRQLFVDHLCSQVGQVQVYVVLAVDTAPLAHFLEHAARHDIARGQVFECGHVTFHEVFALAVQQSAALAARRLAQQYAHFIDAGRVELVHLHIFQGNAPAVGNRHAISGAGKGVAGDTPGASIAAGREKHRLRMERVNLSCANLQRHHAACLTIAHQEIKHQVFVEETHLVFNCLLIHCLKDHVSRAVGRVAGAAHRPLAEITGMPPKAALVDAPVSSAVER